MKAQLELLPRPHCNLCAIDMWLVESHWIKTGLIQILTFKCVACERQETKLLDITTNQELGPRDLAAE
jgi:hypothetical protein